MALITCDHRRRLDFQELLPVVRDAITGIAKKAMANDDRIVGFKRFLESLNAQEIASLDTVAVADLQTIAEMVASMAQASHAK